MGQGAKPHEAESSLALEAPAEEPNFTLTDVRFVFSMSLSITIASRALMLRICRVDDLCVCVRKVYCGKMADWIRMPFRVMSGVRLGMGVLDGGGNCRRGRGSLE